MHFVLTPPGPVLLIRYVFEGDNVEDEMLLTL